jgi:hypothetical protein
MRRAAPTFAALKKVALYDREELLYDRDEPLYDREELLYDRDEPLYKNPKPWDFCGNSVKGQILL